MTRRWKLTALVCLLLLPGCAYFNTFYLARKYFNDAERLRTRANGVVTPDIRKNYGSAIEWASAILTDYKDSRYVDDSLFIIGMSQFYQNDVSRAMTKFDELLKYFPESDLAPQARFQRARCLELSGQIDEAITAYSDIVNGDDRSIRAKSGLALATVWRGRERWQESLDAARRVSDLSPTRSERHEALYLIAEARWRLEEYDESIVTLAPLENEKLAPNLRFQVNSLLARCQATLGRYDEAMIPLTQLQGRGELADYIPRIQLEVGNVYILQKDTNRAIDTFRKLAGDYPDSLAGREAWYHVGMLLLSDLKNAKDARAAFESARKGTIRTSAAWYRESLEKTTQIDSLLSKLNQIEKLDRILRPEVYSAMQSAMDDSTGVAKAPDSTRTAGDTRPDSLRVASRTDSTVAPLDSLAVRTPTVYNPIERLAALRYSLAEIYLYSFDRPDSAATQFHTIIAEAPASDYAVKSDYFLRLDELSKKGEPTEADEQTLMRSIIEEYPESAFAQDLKVLLGIIDAPPEEKAFMEAEKAQLDGKSTEDYLALFQQVVDRWPGTPYAWQARYVIAYITEHELGDTEAAMKLYERLAQEPPAPNGNKYIALAKEKIALAKQEQKSIEDAKKSIAYFENRIAELRSGIVRTSSNGDSTAVALSGNGITGQRKIRARNAQIRSRYYSY